MCLFLVHNFSRFIFFSDFFFWWSQISKLHISQFYSSVCCVCVHLFMKRTALAMIFTSARNRQSSANHLVVSLCRFVINNFLLSYTKRAQIRIYDFNDTHLFIKNSSMHSIIYTYKSIIKYYYNYKLIFAPIQRTPWTIEHKTNMNVHAKGIVLLANKWNTLHFACKKKICHEIRIRTLIDALTRKCGWGETHQIQRDRIGVLFLECMPHAAINNV